MQPTRPKRIRSAIGWPLHELDSVIFAYLTLLSTLRMLCTCTKFRWARVGVYVRSVSLCRFPAPIQPLFRPLRNLQTLIIDNTGLSHVTYLKFCRILKTLVLRNTEVISLHGIPSKLKELFLKHCPKMADISSLSACVGIEVLCIEECRKLRERELMILEGKGSLPNLTTFCIRDCVSRLPLSLLPYEVATICKLCSSFSSLRHLIIDSQRVVHAYAMEPIKKIAKLELLVIKCWFQFEHSDVDPLVIRATFHNGPGYSRAHRIYSLKTFKFNERDSRLSKLVRSRHTGPTSNLFLSNNLGRSNVAKIAYQSHIEHIWDE